MWNRPRTTNSVFITFDDGPHPSITPWVLDELDKVNAKATFFVVGENAEAYPEVMSEIVSRGHSIGNHTYRHVKGWGMNAEDYLSEILACEEVIKDERLFRPPYGRINFKAIKLLKNYKIIMWDVLSKDYLPGLKTARALNRIKKNTEKGSIVVFHDSEKAEKNLKFLLPKYLQFLSNKGVNMQKL